MADRNLADPNYEPTDEELRELMHRAFQGVTARRALAEREMRERMAEARARATGTSPSTPEKK
ncbi:MAG: hypothetical protein HYV09_07330 [Deltaproteobacteria bacterium]|nr:hypothetical protein [Deltaproteobacteria bacterium]